MIFLSTSCREHRSASLPLAQSRLNLLPWDTRSLRGACWEARTLLGHVYARFFQWPQKSTPLVRLLSKPEADVMFQVNASLSLSQIWFLHMYNFLFHAWQPDLSPQMWLRRWPLRRLFFSRSILGTASMLWPCHTCFAAWTPQNPGYYPCHELDLSLSLCTLVYIYIVVIDR